MILHLIEDDHFSPYAIKQFTAGSEEINKFLLIIPEPTYEIKYIKSLENVLVLVFNSVEYRQFIDELYKFKAIISHNLLTEWKAEIIQYTPATVKIAWVFWGAELYNRNDYTMKFLAHSTKKIYIRYFCKQLLKKALNEIVFKKKYAFKYEAHKDIFRKITYCLTDVSEDALEAQEYFETEFLPLWYNYYSIEETVGELMPYTCTGNNILLGNSATITNNHLEAIKLLSVIPLGKRQVITPLNYGDNYIIPIVRSYGFKMLKNNFLSIDTYLMREEYNQIIKDCSIAIFNHHRPQALGNILTSLWLGGRVYLSKRSLLYTYLRKIGIILFNVEDHLKPENQQVLDELPVEDIQHNRDVLIAVYGKDEMASKIQQVISILNE